MTTYTYITLDDPNAGTLSNDKAETFGINNEGQIVGFYYDVGTSGKNHAFLYNLADNSWTTIDNPNYGSNYINQAMGINDNGQIDGFTRLNFNTPTPTLGFLDNGGIYTSIQAPGQTTLLRGINDEGRGSPEFIILQTAHIPKTTASSTTTEATSRSTIHWPA